MTDMRTTFASLYGAAPKPPLRYRKHSVRKPWCGIFDGNETTFAVRAVPHREKVANGGDCERSSVEILGIYSGSDC